jgi:DNA-binding CsgD family transcriptional regulator
LFSGARQGERGGIIFTMELLERETSLQELATAWREAAAGEGRVALVSGEAGIGKTSLVERFTREHRASGRVLWGACDALFTPRPLGPLHDMAGQVKGSLPALLSSDANRTALFSAVLAELQTCPTIAVFEDVHWADEATLDLLKFLGRRVTRTTALVVLTYRDDELGPQHPLRTVLGDMATSPAVRRVALSSLSETAVRSLVGERAIDPVALHRQTAGNPFFITEVLSSAEGGLPATVRDAVLARAARLSPSALAVLQAAAVIGPRIEPWVLSDITGAEAMAAEECLAMGVLVTQGEGLAFRHELARQTILDAVAPHQRLVLHGLVLEALKSSAVTRSDLARLAHHAQAAGDREAVLAYAASAARRAATAGAHREAAALYDLALRFAGDVPPHERGLWLEERARELHTIGALEECVTTYQQAIDLWRAVDQPRKEGGNLARLALILFHIGQAAEAERASHRALEILQALPPSPELAVAYRMQAHLRMLHRDCGDAIAWGQRAIELAESFAEREILVDAYTTVGAALLLTDYERGRETLERSFRVAHEIGHDSGATNVYANLGSISCEIFRLHRAEAFLQEGLAYAGERDLDLLKKYLLAWQALTWVFLGRWTQVIGVAREALHGLGVTAIGRIPALMALGRLQARRGDADPGAPLDEALELATQRQTLQRLGLVRAARAEAAWLAGDNERTLEEARAAYELAVSKRHPWITGELAFWRWRAGDDVALPDWVAKPFALQIAGEWRAAAAEWEQLGCPYEQARALADGDAEAQRAALEIFDRLGARPAAEDLREKMRTAGVRNIPRGPRSATRDNPFGLTARQLEILNLLAEDLSNPEIAARLHLSPKTVDHHVSAVLAKLDVHSREEAAELVRGHPRFQPPG